MASSGCPKPIGLRQGIFDSYELPTHGVGGLMSNVTRIESQPRACSSESMQAIYKFADRAARTEAKVLITGESGVGKDVLARRIHARSARAS
jgi:transcriptional regulator of acetoin/glycerol metabolism